MWSSQNLFCNFAKIKIKMMVTMGMRGGDKTCRLEAQFVLAMSLTAVGKKLMNNVWFEKT